MLPSIISPSSASSLSLFKVKIRPVLFRSLHAFKHLIISDTFSFSSASSKIGLIYIQRPFSVSTIFCMIFLSSPTKLFVTSSSYSRFRLMLSKKIASISSFNSLSCFRSCIQRKWGRTLVNAWQLEVERSSRPGRYISFDSHKFLVRPILGSKTTILDLETSISGMYINRYQYDTLARPQFRRTTGGNSLTNDIINYLFNNLF